MSIELKPSTLTPAEMLLWLCDELDRLAEICTTGDKPKIQAAFKCVMRLAAEARRVGERERKGGGK